MARYAKGASAERELLKQFFEAGFSVARVAGSGVSSLPSPDLLAFSRLQRFGLECKAWDSSSLTIPKRQFEDLLGWCDTADCQAVFAWKVSREGWFFLFPKFFHKTGKAYAISKETARKKSISFGVLTGQQATLKTEK